MPVAVAGMHRSGTSMVTRLLNLCGLYLGEEKDIIPSAKDNLEGFWENTKFQAINEQILAAFDGAWDTPPLLEENWESSILLTDTSKNAQQVIEEISRASDWGWKDPRNSLTLPFWKKQIPNLKVVICLRNPLDVYHSLASRAYASQKFSDKLWVEYYQQLMASTVDEERIITHYDSFFYDPQSELRRLVNFLELDVSDDVIQVACKTISNHLRHNTGKMNDLYVTSPLYELYEKLCMQAGSVYQRYVVQVENEYQKRIISGENTTREDVQKLYQSLQAVNHENSRLRLEILKLREDKIYIQGTIDEIFASRSWRFIQVFQKIRLFFIPYGSLRERILQAIYSAGIKYKYTKDSLAKRKEITLNDSNQKQLLPSSDIVFKKVYADLIVTAQGTQKDEYIPITDETYDANEALIKLIAFYLPQFHPIPENDEWWGKGFVEWTNVSKAIPQFSGHYQPHLPGELGFYDLRLPEVQKRQIELARKYGLHGFAFHYYWFNGKRLLEKPLDLFLNSKEDFPFCICWANENWTRHWDGRENEVLIAQAHSPESDLQFIRDVSPILRDERYIRIDGRPLLIVYRANIIPDIKRTVKLWRDYCIENGIGDPYLVAAQTHWFEDPRKVGFDAAVEFPPHNVSMTNIRDRVQISNPNYTGSVYAYSEMVEKKIATPPQKYKVFRTIFPGWDNEARKPGNGNTFAFSSPALYKNWLIQTAKITLQDPDPEKRLVFINAWNEWGEGAHLEPDRKYGYAYLQATLDALKEINRQKNKFST